MSCTSSLPPEMTITCADCGEMQYIPPLPPGAAAECHRCDRELARHSRGGYGVTLACAALILLLLPPAFLLPLMDSTIKQIVRQEGRLVPSVPVIYSEVLFPFAFGFFFFAFLFPALRALFQLVVLGSLKLGFTLWQRGRMFRWSEELRMWSMTDAVVIAFVGNRALDRQKIRNDILPDLDTRPAHRLPSCDVCEMAVDYRRPGDPCPRCGSRLDRDIAPRFAPSIGAVAAGIPLCFPAHSAATLVNDP